jgi:hypothetical protein
MGSNSASAGGSDAGFENTKKSKVSTLTKAKIAIKNFEPIPVKIIKAFTEGAKKSKQNVMDYEGQAAGVTPMRTPFKPKRDDNGGNGGNQVVTAPAQTMAVATAPTTAEVSQSAATDVAEDDILLRKRKVKAKGRSPTILTGVTGTTGGLTLGKPSLLGRA